jgi:short-subunit dehydrogenase
MDIIITGASRGIGYEVVKSFCSIEDTTILALSRNEEKLKNLVAECKSINPEAKIIAKSFDLEEYWHTGSNISPFVSEHMKKVDILINNAGQLYRKPLYEHSNTEIHQLFSVNVFAVLGMIRDLYPLLKRSKKAHVINIGSMAGFQGSSKFSGLSVYGACKAAIAGFTESIAAEFKDDGIRCNCLALGAVQTEMLQQAFPDFKAPLTPVEMAKYIADFAIYGRSFYNGKVIPVSASIP